MTELSRNSRNKGTFTDSGTGERSKEGPTHPYSGNQSDTPSQYSASGLRQSESPEDLDYNFEIALQYIMPLISTIKQENEHLKHQKTQIEGEMSALQKLSHMILKENQQLRRHYSARTSDIKKLIETISINTHQEINDANHQAFLLRESNCMIVKHIEGLMKELREVDQTNQSRRAQLDQLAQKNIAIQKVNRDLQVKNKQLFYRCEKITTEANALESTQDDEEINELLSEVTALKNKNKSNIKMARGLLVEHNEEKPLLEENLRNLAAKNQELGGEAKDLEGKMKLAESASETNRQKYEQSAANLLKALKEYERGKTSLEEIERQIVQTKEFTTQSILQIKKNEQTLHNLTHQKEELKKIIATKKESLKKIQDGARETSEQQDSTHRQTLKKIRDSITQQQSRANEQICSKISPESTMIQSSISESKEEFAALVQEVDELRQTMSKWQNPIREIMRLQFQLKKRRREKK